MANNRYINNLQTKQQVHLKTTSIVCWKNSEEISFPLGLGRHKPFLATITNKPAGKRSGLKIWTPMDNTANCDLLLFLRLELNWQDHGLAVRDQGGFVAY